jgi:hypothetical protein
MTMRYDRVELKARIDAAGFIHDTPVLTRTGIFEYRSPDGSVRREYRPPEVVFHKDSLAAYKGLPITDGHLGKMTAKNIRAAMIGTVLSPGRQDEQDKTNLVSDITIHDTSPVLEGGKKELSVGYEVELDETPGVSPEGEHYDAMQIRVLPNHLAACKKGRAGNARLNLDAADAVVDDNEEDPTMTMVKVKTKTGMAYDAAPEISHEVDTLRADLAVLTTERDKLQARADAAEADVKKLKEGEAKLRQDAKDAALARVQLEAKATVLKVEFKADSTDRQLREGVIHAVKGKELKFDGKSDDYVNAMYDLAVTEAGDRKTNEAANREALGLNNGRQDEDEREDADDDKPSTSSVSARARYLARQGRQ